AEQSRALEFTLATLCISFFLSRLYSIYFNYKAQNTGCQEKIFFFHDHPLVQKTQPFCIIYWNFKKSSKKKLLINEQFSFIFFVKALHSLLLISYKEAYEDW
ncbi:MAG: hypothetical protein IJM03_03135, partial [Treponema sp.]|nr:hypothetical protein [Treponema sp.]